jgi:two-component system OmpR family response regulator
MSYHDLMIIDEVPVDSDFINYFHQYNITITQHKYIPQTPHPLPVGVVISWHILSSQINSVNYWRQHHTCPLFVLDDVQHEEHCIHALVQGADNYLIKPLSARELYAHIIAVTRRSGYNSTAKELFFFSHWRLDPASRQVFNQYNQAVTISNTEYDLLYLFIQEPYKILSRELLLRKTNNNVINPLDRRIDVQISRLRQKLELDAKNPNIIQTVRNQGYIFNSAVTRTKGDATQ